MTFQSTRPSRGETVIFVWKMLVRFRFQSTRPSRGETANRKRQSLCNPYFNPLAPRGARPVHSPCGGEVDLPNSIHSPLAGRDKTQGNVGVTTTHFNPLAPRGARLKCLGEMNINLSFQSTRPSRGETPTILILTGIIYISIHSPLAGRD